MNGTRATLAIARRHMRPSWLLGICARITVGVAAGLAPIANPTVHASPVYYWGIKFLAVFFGAMAGTELRVRDLMYFAAPLYGRQLARAHALTAIIAALAYPLAFILALKGVVFPRGEDPFFWSAVLGALGFFCVWGVFGMVLPSVVAALVGLSATLRKGAAAAVYFVLAIATGAALGLIFQFGLLSFGWLGLALTIALAIVLGFIALRAFGETLARYDPIE